MANSIPEGQSKKNEKIVLPSFGFISAMATSAAFLPHALVVLGAMFFHRGFLIDPTKPLLFFTLLARFTGDWVFWVKSFPHEMDDGKNNNWRTSIKEVLTSQPTAIKAINDIVIDAIVDGVLLYCAFNSATSPLWILFTYSFCQGIGAPIQGIVLRIFDRRYLRKFSMIVTVLATFLVLEASGVISFGYIRMFGLSQFPLSSQVLFFIGAKCLLASTTVIAKELIAETLKLTTMRDLKT